jgi:tetratricopeptide (TPR) repeat protein
MPASTNTTDPATLAAAEALAALGVGDTALARQKYAEAGAILEREMKVRHGGSEKQLLRFLAATQYHKGGDYKKAQELAKKIDARVLPENVRGLFPQFLKDVKERSSPEYALSIRRIVDALWRGKKPREAIEVLQNHPYVYDAAGLAFMRAVLCERIGDYRAAALFFRSLRRYAPGVTDAVFLPAAYPLALTTQGRIAEASEYVQYQLELLPHPVTSVTASILCYHRSFKAAAEERKRLLEEQLAFAEQAREAYQRLPTDQQNHPDMKEYLAFGFEVAALTCLLRGEKERGKEVWAQAVKLGANPTTAWAKRAFAAAPNESDGKESEVEYLSERETQFSARFDPESSVRQQLELVGA